MLPGSSLARSLAGAFRRLFRLTGSARRGLRWTSSHQRRLLPAPLSAEFRKTARRRPFSAWAVSGSTLPRVCGTGRNVPMIASSRKLCGSTDNRPYAISIRDRGAYTRSVNAAAYSRVGTVSNRGS